MCQKHEVNESQVVSVIPNLKNMNKNNARQGDALYVSLIFRERIAEPHMSSSRAQNRELSK